MSDWAQQEAETIASAIRKQNWKNGGVLEWDHDEAVGFVAASLELAFARGRLQGTKEAYVATQPGIKRATRTQTDF